MAIWSVAFIGIRPIASLVDGAIAAVAGTTVATLAMTMPVAARHGAVDRAGSAARPRRLNASAVGMTTTGSVAWCEQ